MRNRELLRDRRERVRSLAPSSGLEPAADEKVPFGVPATTWNRSLECRRRWREPCMRFALLLIEKGAWRVRRERFCYCCLGVGSVKFSLFKLFCPGKPEWLATSPKVYGLFTFRILLSSFIESPLLW